jgi:hypothetical protein
MTGKEKKYVLNIIENEGFEYTFEYYSNFEEIKDEQFHKLKDVYLKAKEELKSYIER